MIREGATTLWEAYSFNTTRSKNHKMFATPLGWMARYVAGLRIDGILDDGPGFRKALIEPYPCPERVSFARLDFTSPVGKYHSGWKLTSEGMTYNISIPPNATGHFRLPLLGHKEATVTESGKVLWKNGKVLGSSDGIPTPTLGEDGRIEMTLAAGSYSFLVNSADSLPR